MNFPTLYSPTEAAKAMGISRSTIYALIKDGSLASMKIGGSRKIADQQIADYLHAAIESTVII